MTVLVARPVGQRRDPRQRHALIAVAHTRLMMLMLLFAAGVALAAHTRSVNRDERRSGAKAALLAGVAALAFGLGLYSTGRVGQSLGVAWAALPIWMRRGFKASGTTRFRPTCSRPFCRSAPSTTMWSASTNRRSNARPAMPRNSTSPVCASALTRPVITREFS